ncbi:TPA: hypothetical protein DIC40_05415 [Patescibacteria group bacterium]|nr:hypothetical protein [Candidatus Gracilibacteria bacterium]
MFCKVFFKVSKETFNVEISTSIGTGVNHNSIIGITSVDHVREENQTLSHFFNFHIFINACNNAILAELQLFTNTQYFLFCHLANKDSNFLQ